MNDSVHSIPRAGESIAGGYVLDELIAAGGMAIVYRGRDPGGAPVAIKIMRAELLEEPTVRARFVREGKLCQSFRHPGVPRIFSVTDLPDGTVAIAMELLSGETVGQRAKRNGGYLPPQEVLAITDRVLDVIEAAHALGIVHRDIKPDNVFLTRDGELKLLDFGVASAREQDGEKLTHAGYALGTPAFMSPEQAQGRWEDVDGRTDLWAIGATMFALLVGEAPHAAASPIQELVAAATNTVPSIDTRVPGLRPALRALVDRALARDADERFADAESMRVAVRAAWLALGGPASMQLVWDHIASEVIPTAPPKDPSIVRFATGEHTLADTATAAAAVAARAEVSGVAPRMPSTAHHTGWSVPPPSDIARIVSREDLASSDEYAALAPLLVTTKRRPRRKDDAAPAPGPAPASPRDRRVLVAIALSLAALALLLYTAYAAMH